MIVEFSEFIVLDSADTSGEETQYQLWGPRIDVVDGKEPSISELIHPTISPNIMYNIRTQLPYYVLFSNTKTNKR